LCVRWRKKSEKDEVREKEDEMGLLDDKDKDCGRAGESIVLPYKMYFKSVSRYVTWT
jgi:hypothetical protein